MQHEACLCVLIMRTIGARRGRSARGRPGDRFRSFHTCHQEGSDHEQTFLENYYP